MIQIRFAEYTYDYGHYDFGDQLSAYCSDGIVKAIHSRVTLTFTWYKI